MANPPIGYVILSFLAVFVSILISFYLGNRENLKKQKKSFVPLIKYFGIFFVVFAVIFVLSALKWDNPFVTLNPLLVEFILGFISLLVMFKLRIKTIWRYVIGILILVICSYFLSGILVSRIF